MGNFKNMFGDNYLHPKNKTHTCMDSFKSLWEENGDYISVQYTGEYSSIKSNRSSILGIFHSIAKVGKGHDEHFKKKCYDVLLNRKEENSNYL
jgi:hypothetical protein